MDSIRVPLGLDGIHKHYEGPFSGPGVCFWRMTPGNDRICELGGPRRHAFTLNDQHGVVAKASMIACLALSGGHLTWPGSFSGTTHLTCAGKEDG